MIAVIAILAVLLVASAILPVWAVPVVIIGSVLLVSVVGALQLRQDDRLGAKPFLELMGMSLRRLPLLAWRKGSPDRDPPK